MSWSSLANNQCISFSNLANAVSTGVFTQKEAIPASNEQITKADANAYVNLNTAYSPYAAKSFNQLVVKSDLQPCVNLPYSYTLYFDYGEGSFLSGLSTPTAACAATNSVTVYSNSSSVGVGTELFFDSCGTEFIGAYAYNNGTSNIYYKIGSSYITFENYDGTGYGHVIRTITPCGGSLATIQIPTNNSLDIQLYLSSITVNGVGVVNVSGVDPNTPGNGGQVQTNQIGVYDIVLTYYSSVSGQKISIVDSAYSYQCNNASTGFNSMTFYGVTINTSVDLFIYVEDGMCY